MFRSSRSSDGQMATDKNDWRRWCAVNGQERMEALMCCQLLLCDLDLSMFSILDTCCMYNIVCLSISMHIWSMYWYLVLYIWYNCCLCIICGMKAASSLCFIYLIVCYFADAKSLIIYTLYCICLLRCIHFLFFVAKWPVIIIKRIFRLIGYLSC